MLKTTFLDIVKKPYFELTAIFFFGVLTSAVINSVFSSVILFLVVLVSVGNLFEFKNELTKYALIASFYIGLSPFYLIARGFLTRIQLANWDLLLYSTVFFLISLIIKIFSRQTGPINSIQWRNLFSSRLFVSLIPLFIFLSVQKILMNKSWGNGVAWVASGDSKNHLVNGVSITKYGFLDPTTFFTQPVSTPTYLALMLSNSDLTVTTNTEILKYQMLIYTFSWIILICILSLSFSSIVETIWNFTHPKSQKVPTILVFISSFIPTFSFILGSALVDGFFTAIFGMASVILMINWYLQSLIKSKLSLGWLLTGSFIWIISVLAWMFVAPLTFLLFALGIRNNIQVLGLNKIKIDLIYLVLSLVILLMIHFSKLGQLLIRNSKIAFNTPGAANVTDPKIFFISLSALIIFGLMMSSTLKKIGLGIILVAILQILVLFGFKIFSNLGLLDWNYYLIKYQWIMFSAVFSLLTGIILVRLFDFPYGNYLHKTYALLIFIGLVYLASELTVSANKVHSKILSGWDNPRAVTLDKAFEFEIDHAKPTMFFHFGYAGEARLANFWLTAFSSPIEPIKGWNYTIDTVGDPMQMCSVNYYYPKMTLITSDTNLGSELKELCPEELFDIKIEPPLFP